MRARIRLISVVAALAAGAVLTSCGDDDEGGGGGLPGAGGGLPDFEMNEELELDTTGGFGDGGAEGDGAPDAEGLPDPGAGGGDPAWFARWEANGATLYTTADGVLYGNPGTGETCRQSVGVQGALDWEPVFFMCQGTAASVTLRLSGDTMAIEWGDRTEELTRAESLDGQTVDLDSLESTILN
ncbi:hypothetical protein FH609_003875 [Streptomyces sp. 3MP-14]|uniref:Uncharacterized protein n=1 Tax=Streptomyces mimosae TaxID=2586635 RepID=A0A5N6A2F8_9ACTN|nr:MULTISPECIES: hypothetical protein [Streptomyces]KAB8162881.1 hypothetical protein FH607_019740 [Streptomyces mimosae]KAB8179094.1 hypothetical protein FH609_003875 [Streptomyces sp. 3MP-14]